VRLVVVVVVVIVVTVQNSEFTELSQGVLGGGMMDKDTTFGNPISL